MNQFSSIDELSTDNDCDDGYISKNALEEIKDGSKMHPLINVRDYRLKIRDHIKQTQSEWKCAQLSAKRTVKGLHEVFDDILNELNNPLPTLREPGSEMSHFITEPRNF